MDKNLIFPGKSEQGIFTYLIHDEKDHLEKTAGEYNPTIAEYIHNAKPINGVTQILLTALGAGEWWGQNVNGDYFWERMLAHDGTDYGFRTFETLAQIYKHHLNKDRTKNFGNVILSVYNPIYHRVELIVGLDNERGPDVARRMEEGNYPDWSMGCRVPYDECNTCGNRAPSRRHYCDCAKYYLNKVHPETGKVVYVYNWYPRFHDISLVLIGADRIAKTLQKVAHSVSFSGIGSAELWDKLAAIKEAATDKFAIIEKRVPASDEPPASQDAVDALVSPIAEVKAREAPLPPSLVSRLAESPLPRVLSTMAAMGIVPKPQEFQRILLIQVGQRRLADELDQRNVCFDPMTAQDPEQRHLDATDVRPGNFDPAIMELLKPYMAERSYAAPLLGRRMVAMTTKTACEEYLPNFIKLAEEKERKPIGIVPIMFAAAAMYAAFAKKAPTSAISGIEGLVLNHPGLAAALGVGITATLSSMFGAGTKGRHSGPYVAHHEDIFDRIDRQKKSYTKTAGASNMRAGLQRLFVGIPAVYMASGILQKHKKYNPFEEESRIKSFVRRNPDLIGMGLAADALMASRGKGTHRALKHVGPIVQKHVIPGAQKFYGKAKKALEDTVGTVPFAKTSSAQDFILSSLVWPTALGKANLPGRIVGGVLDQAILEVGQKLVNKHHAQPSQPKPAQTGIKTTPMPPMLKAAALGKTTL